MMVEVTNPSQQVPLFEVSADGQIVLTVEGLKYFRQIVDKLDDHEARLAAGGL